VPTQATAEKINSDFLNGLDIDSAKARAPSGSRAGPRRAQGQLPLRDCWSPASASGAAPFRPSTAPITVVVPVPEDQLPDVAPDDVEFLPTGQSPLASTRASYTRPGPICGGPARRGDRHHGHLRRPSWYFLRFCDPWSTDRPFDPEAARHLHGGGPVIGGIEHAILHLLLLPLLHPRAIIDTGSGPRPRLREPFRALSGPGMIRMDGGKIVTIQGQPHRPEHYYETVGADGLRLFHLVRRPALRRHGLVDQTDQVIEGCGRFMDRLWRTFSPTAVLRDGAAHAAPRTPAPESDGRTTGWCARPPTAPSPR